MVNILNLFVEVLQLQMRKRMKHLSCRFLSFMEGKDFAESLKGEEGTKKWYQTMCRLSVLFSSIFLPQLCDHIVIITRFSSWVSQDHEIPIWTAFPLWISYGNISPQGCRMFMGPRSHLKSRHSNEKMPKKAANGWIMPWLWNQFLFVVFFWAKTARLGMFCCFSWSWFFHHINPCVCSPLRIDFINSVISRQT